MAEIMVIGGGLAGCEAAWQLARRGVTVHLYEMRPLRQTGAHTGEGLAELVCSNSLGSLAAGRAPGLLKEELRQLNSLLLTCAEQAALPAGGALAVDREAFSDHVTRALLSNPLIHLHREEVTAVPEYPTLIASGPLTSPALAASIQALTGEEDLFFFDAIAPIIAADSINMETAYRASRYGTGEQDEGDYINCPLDETQYNTFMDALLSAERISLHHFEASLEEGVRAGKHVFFEGCLPVEVLARRGREALAFGPMRPVGLRDPRTGRWPYAVVQLRQDNLAGDLYNLVGFQTNLTFPEQKRVFQLIPGLENAEFVRYGQMHRNTFIASPRLLNQTMEFRSRSGLFFAGQIVGVEGYMGNIATGLLAGVNAARFLHGKELLVPPLETMLGSMVHYITHADMADFQPMKANFGLLPALETPYRGKREKAASLVSRSLTALESWWQSSEGNENP